MKKFKDFVEAKIAAQYGSSNDQVKPKLYNGEESSPEDDPAGRVTQSGRYALKPMRHDAPRGTSIDSMVPGVNRDHLTNLRAQRDPKKKLPYKERLSRIKYLEQSKGVPFVSWVIFALKDMGALVDFGLSKDEIGTHPKPGGNEVAWDALRKGQVKEQDVRNALSKLAINGFGDLSYEEFKRLLPSINWVPPRDAVHHKQQATNNGFIP